MWHINKLKESEIQSSVERKLPYSVHCHVCRVYVGPLKELFIFLTERCGIFISSSHSFIAKHTLSFIHKILLPQIHTIDTTHLLLKNISFSFFISEEHLERLDQTKKQIVPIHQKLSSEQRMCFVSMFKINSFCLVKIFFFQINI